MQCYVYRSPRKAETYLLLPDKAEVVELPPALLEVFGEPELAFEFELTPERRLAQGDAIQVLENLRQKGFHLQMPPENQRPF